MVRATQAPDYNIAHALRTLDT